MTVERRLAVVTGAAGFIGSHLVDHLLAEGWAVRGIDDFSVGTVENLSVATRHLEFELIEESIHDERILGGIIDGATHVFHLAAKLGPASVERFPAQTFSDTILSTSAVLAAVEPARIPLFFASTSEVYGDSANQPLCESDDIRIAPPAHPRSSYALAKGAAELLVNTYRRERGGRVVIGRLFNTIGPRQSPAHGLVAERFVSNALRDLPLVIEGRGDQTRSFTDVRDVARAISAVMMSNATHGSTINIGSSHEISISELARLVLTATGSRSPVEYQTYEAVHGEGARDVRRRVPDVTLLRRLANFSCEIPLTDTLSNIIEAHRKDAELNGWSDGVR